MNNKVKLELGELIANRYRLTSLLYEKDEYSLYSCEYDDWIFVAKVYYPNLNLDEKLIDRIRGIGLSNISRVIDSCYHKGYYCIIRPYYRRGSLLKGIPFKADFLTKDFLPNILDTLRIVHENDLVFGLIRPNNIFYSDITEDLFMGDFGISVCKMTGLNNAFFAEDENLYFTAPEAINDYMTLESDYYALGITLFFLATGGVPFGQYKGEELVRAIYTQEVKVPDKMDPLLADIIKGLTLKNKHMRWGFSQVNRALRDYDVEIKDDYIPDNELIERNISILFPKETIEEAVDEEVLISEEAPLQDEDTNIKDEGLTARERLEMIIAAESKDAAELEEPKELENKTDIKAQKAKIKPFSSKVVKKGFDPLNKENISAFVFKDREFYDIESLIPFMADNWEDSIEKLYGNEIIDFFRRNNVEIANAAKKCKEIDNKDLGLFKFIYDAYSDMPLVWRGRVFNDLNEIVDEILIGKNDEIYEEMLSYGIFSHYFIIKKDEDMLNKVLPLECEMRATRRNVKNVLYLLMYELGERPIFIFNNYSFDSVDNLLDYFEENISELEIICSKLINDAMFFAWLKYLGYEDVINKWRDKISKVG